MLWLAYLLTAFTSVEISSSEVYFGKQTFLLQNSILWHMWKNCTFLVYNPDQCSLVQYHGFALDLLVASVYSRIFFDNMKHFLLKNNKENNINLWSKILFWLCTANNSIQKYVCLIQQLNHLKSLKQGKFTWKNQHWIKY